MTGPYRATGPAPDEEPTIEPVPGPEVPAEEQEEQIEGEDTEEPQNPGSFDADRA